MKIDKNGVWSAAPAGCDTSSAYLMFTFASCIVIIATVLLLVFSLLRCCSVVISYVLLLPLYCFYCIVVAIVVVCLVVF